MHSTLLNMSRARLEHEGEENFNVGDDNVIPIPAAGLQAVHGPAGTS